MGGELQKTMGAVPSNKLKHFIEGDKFVCVIDPQSRYGQCIDHVQFVHLTPEQDARIIDYTTRENNKIVEVFYIERSNLIRIVTHYYENYYPLTIISENCYYEEDIFRRRSEALVSFMRDLDRVEIFYHRVVDEYEKFLQATGLYIQDMNANNILVTDDFDDFRLVDIASIQKPDGPIKVDPVGLLLTGKLRWPDGGAGDGILRQYLPHSEKLIVEIETRIKPRNIL